MYIYIKSIYLIVLHTIMNVLNYSKWIIESPTKVNRIEASLQSGMFLDEIFIIIKYLKKRIFFIDIFLPFLIATFF